jgi:hypothetical protein
MALSASLTAGACSHHASQKKDGGAAGTTDAAGAGADVTGEVDQRALSFTVRATNRRGRALVATS